MDSAGRAWRALATNSFGIYYVHPLVLYPLAYLLVGLSAPSLSKASVLVLVTLVTSLVVSAVVLKRLPGPRKAF
jgi:surface polysaccharide O-acyltransferase-like enzyme